MTESTLLAALLANESGGKNINNTTQGTSSGQAQGFFQITTGTWDEFGGQKYAPNPQAASYADQAAVASKIPLSRWDNTTIARMRATGIPVDPHKTLGENLASANESFADFKPGSELPVGKKGAPPTAVAAVAPAGQTPPTYQPPSPQAQLGSTIGQALAGLGASMSSPGGGGGFMDTPDQPAIRSMAAQTDFTQPSNPLPAQFAGGSGGLGSQLGALAAQPAEAPLESAATAPSITAGAPSMTAMLGALGTNATPSLFDQRSSALSPNPYRPTMRLS